VTVQIELSLESQIEMGSEKVSSRQFIHRCSDEKFAPGELINSARHNSEQHEKATTGTEQNREVITLLALPSPLSRRIFHNSFGVIKFSHLFSIMFRDCEKFWSSSAVECSGERLFFVATAAAVVGYGWLRRRLSRKQANEYSGSSSFTTAMNGKKVFSC
jgi:hypothetical protein